MRILLVSQRFPPDDVGGVERYTQTLARELVMGGDKVSVVTRRPEPSQSEIRLLRERLPDRSVVYRMVGGSVRFDRFLQHYEALERLFTLALLESQPDVVHINHLIGLSPRFVQIAQRLGAAVVISLHDFYFACARVHLQKLDGGACAGPDQGRECARTCFTDPSANGPVRWGLRTEYFRRLLSSAHAVIAYSNFVAEYFQSFAGLGNIVKIPNGISRGPDPPECESAARYDPDRPFTVAYCGMVARHKGPHIILEALKIAGLSSVNVVLIGHIPELEYYRQLREAAETIPGLRMQMYGKYERSDLNFLLRDVDCVVSPSLVPEAGPIVPREALARGVPILVSRLGALPELVIEGENGFTFGANRPIELAAKLRKLASDKPLLRRLRAGALGSPIVTVAEHAVFVRRVYEDALRYTGTAYPPRADFDFFHESLRAMGCQDGKAHSSLGRGRAAGKG